MEWNSIGSADDIRGIIELSNSKPQVIFKHSTTCPVSSMAKMRVEDNWSVVNKDLDFNYLDLHRHRDISQMIATELNVHHESPQIILLVDGEVIYDASHFDITIQELNESLDFHFDKK
ncbi:bacillithiol system redox-active protein YtxJ [Portibacter marinus]|uniref:bacillithiol system redox-active protein YtxJ n=1 Tax=Portibacter marinus TaxID=2898660 RepID=UPI001F1EA1BC|nr:bacillithiol system redox-active protein YtxJ [Portibacter marinus]